MHLRHIDFVHIAFSVFIRIRLFPQTTHHFAPSVFRHSTRGRGRKLFIFTPVSYKKATSLLFSCDGVFALSLLSLFMTVMAMHMHMFCCSCNSKTLFFLSIAIFFLDFSFRYIMIEGHIRSTLKIP